MLTRGDLPVFKRAWNPGIESSLHVAATSCSVDVFLGAVTAEGLDSRAGTTVEDSEALRHLHLAAPIPHHHYARGELNAQL